jgi:hypothetical protein
MSGKPIKLSLLLGYLLNVIIFSAYMTQAQEGAGSFKPQIPKTWDDEAVASMEVPLANPDRTPKHISSEYYYKMVERVFYKSYPVYAPGKEPPGYMDWLKQQEPEIAFDATKLKTKEDWIKAGELVFEAPIAYAPTFQGGDPRDPEWYKKTGTPVTRDGIMPFSRYVIREKGTIELGQASCATCHTRVLPDGTVIKGAQGNYPIDRAESVALRAAIATTKDRKALLDQIRFGMKFSGVPWSPSDPQARVQQLSLEEIAELWENMPPGVIERYSHFFNPPQVPDLIGVKDRKYFDRTGNVRHRSIGDLMRYVALVQGVLSLAHYGDYSALGGLPPPDSQGRYSDEALYALALYIYSLQPPPNPNKFDAEAARGEKIFQREGCATCHTPPLYTNNRLTPVDGFTTPRSHLNQFDILSMSVGTDSGLALSTLKGTGYYKVPSLKGVWYRGPFEHQGSVMTLEDWFDPRRLADDYVPTGFRGYKVKARAVKGHAFGLTLSAADRKALIAFLKTL